MLRLIEKSAALALFCVCILLSAESYGQAPTPTKASNEPETQATDSSKRVAINRDTTQKPAPIIALPVTPDTKKKSSDKTEQAESKSSAEWWLVVFNGLLVVVVGLQWFWMTRQEKWMRANVEVAKESAEAAKKSADASLLALRPWVSCEVKIISDLTYRANGDACITIRFILRNNGHSPAMGVRLNHWFHLMSPVHTHSILAQQRIADLLRDLPVSNPEYGLLLFPSETHISDIELPISRIEIEKSIEDIKPKKSFFPELIGLVSYTYPFASHRPQTGFIFYLRKIVPDKIYGYAFNLDEPIVPAGNIILLDHGLWGAYAT